ncbi:MAG: sugar phosphate nucleotidyltransferase [Anaerolineaceae bacterium]|nr:sugar phosphate nucleotidyltransferase [Anaerolineaceae bacterium]
MHAVILAGGKGTRLAPYTKIFPKPMMPIGDKAILEILLHQLKAAGINHVTLTVGHLSGLMRAYFQDGSQYDLDIQYSYEDFPLGTAGPLANITHLTQTFLVANGDVLSLLPIAELVQFHKEHEAICTIAMHQRAVKIDLGVIEMDECCQVTDYIEKPTIDYRVSMGLYVFEPRVLEYIPQGEYLDFPNLVKKLLAAGERVLGFPYDGYWQDLGNPADYEQAVEDFDSLKHLFLPNENKK